MDAPPALCSSLHSERTYLKPQRILSAIDRSVLSMPGSTSLRSALISYAVGVMSDIDRQLWPNSVITVIFSVVIVGFGIDT